jgi:site-specific DNA-methyltransferase (adenine-specific)
MKTNYLYNENCLDTMAKMADKFIDLTVTSPPYDGLRTYNGYSFDFESIAKELYRVTKEGGVVVWVVGDATVKGSESGTSFKQALFFKDCGFNLHDTMIFNRHGKFPNQNRYWQNFEYMFILSKGKPNTFNPIHEPKAASTMKRWGNTKNTDTRYSKRNKEGETQVVKSKNNKHLSETKSKGNIWYLPTGNNCATRDKCAFDHPAIFPEQLANDHIISWSNEGDVVYDCFAGSGTTAKMSIINKRKWIASEMSSEYCDIIHERLNKFDNDIFLNGND